MYGFA